MPPEKRIICRDEVSWQRRESGESPSSPLFWNPDPAERERDPYCKKEVSVHSVWMVAILISLPLRGIEITEKSIFDVRQNSDDGDDGDDARSRRCSSPPHRLGKFCYRKSVQDVGFGQPGAAQLENAITHLLQVRCVVGIGVDHKLHALDLGHAQMQVAQI